MSAERGSTRLVAVRAEAVHGLMVIGGLVAVLVAVFCASVAAPDETLWASRSTVAALICVFTVPLLAATTAIATGARMAGLSATAAASPSGASFPARVVWMAGLGWALVIWPVQSGVGLLAHPPHGPLSVAITLPWLEAGLYLVAGVTLGAAVGSRFWAWPSGVVVAGLFFGWLYVGSFPVDRWNLLSPFDNGTSFQEWTQPDLRTILAYCVVAVALTIGCLPIVFGCRWVTRILTAALALLLIVGAVFQVARYGTRVVDRPVGQAPRCSVGREVQVCLWASFTQAQADQVADRLTAARRVVGARWTVPTRFVQEELAQSVSGKAFAIGLPLDARTASLSSVYAVLPTCVGPSEAASTATSNLSQWLQLRLGAVQPIGEDEISVVAASSDQVQDQWLRGQLAQGHCS